MDYIANQYHNTPLPPLVDERLALAHPVRRFLARGLDLALYTLLWTAFTHLVLRWHTPDNIFGTLLTSYASLTLMIFIEPLLLSRLGTTPGKAILGLVVRTEEGWLLSYGDALSRTFRVFAHGYGYGVPMYNLIRAARCYQASGRGEAMPWDEDLDYTVSDSRVLRWLGLALASALVMALMYAVLIQAQLPRYRGDITLGQYVANVNEILSRPPFRGYGYRMTQTGEWLRLEHDVGYSVHFLAEGRPPVHQITLSDGVVTAVGFEVRREDSSWVRPYASQKHIMALAFLASQTELSARELFSARLDYNRFDSYEERIGAVVVSQQVEYRGYRDVGGILLPTEGEEQYFHLVFSMKKDSN